MERDGSLERDRGSIVPRMHHDAVNFGYSRFLLRFDCNKEPPRTLSLYFSAPASLSHLLFPLPLIRCDSALIVCRYFESKLLRNFSRRI